MNFIKFPAIEQYRTVVKVIRDKSNFVGLDAEEKPIFDDTKGKPKIEFIGTVKLHGTNSGVGFDGEELWAQKRGGFCTLEDDNAKFAVFVESKRDVLLELCKSVPLKDGEELIIFGEWCGKGVQKGVAISELEKMFVIFDAKIIGANGDRRWFDIEEIKMLGNGLSEQKIFNIYHFPTFKVEVDFNKPELSQNIFAEITEKVEADCPFASWFGISGVGEGIVWRSPYKDNMYRFKVKGEKHSVTKVKTLSAVDIELIASYREFAEYAVTENRLKQAINEVFGDEEPSRKKTGDFLRWIVNDIIKEESDTLSKNGLDPKAVNKYISEAAKKWLFIRY